jgi:hypothetical protein
LFCRRRRSQNANAAIKATPATAPTALPAIVPVFDFFGFEVSLGVGVFGGLAVGETFPATAGGGVAEVEEAVVEAVEEDDEEDNELLEELEDVELGFDIGLNCTPVYTTCKRISVGCPA